MARYPGAELRLLPAGVNHSSGGMGPIHGVVLHVIVGSLSAADGAFHNPNWKASAHFGVDFDGHTVQWVDTADKAWAEAAGNPYWISVETAGTPDRPLTDAQVSAMARIVRWAHDTHGGFALQPTDDVNGYGLGVHYMGGVAWGGHSCPGPIRAGQRAEIVRRATGAPTPQPPPTPTPPPAAQEDDEMSMFIQGGDPGTVYLKSRGGGLRQMASAQTIADSWYLGEGRDAIPVDANVKIGPGGAKIVIVAPRYIDELKAG